MCHLNTSSYRIDKVKETKTKNQRATHNWLKTNKTKTTTTRKQNKAQTKTIAKTKLRKYNRTTSEKLLLGHDQPPKIATSEKQSQNSIYSLFQHKFYTGQSMETVRACSVSEKIGKSFWPT